MTDHVLKFSQLLLGSIKIVDKEVMGGDKRPFLIVVVVVDIVVVVVVVPVVGTDDLVGDASRTRLIGRSFHFATAPERINGGDVPAVVCQYRQR